MANEADNLDVVIIGGGVAGLTTTALLAREEQEEGHMHFMVVFLPPKSIRGKSLLSIVFMLWTDMLCLDNKKKNSNATVTTKLEQNINNMNQLPKKSGTI